MPKAMRKLVMICGKAAGNTTRRNSSKPVTPKFCAERTYTSGMLCTAVIVPVTIGKNAPRKMMKIAASSWMPNDSTAIGIHAKGEIGRKPCTSGLIARYTRFCHPAHKPNGMPINAATAKPVSTRYKLATV